MYTMYIQAMSIMLSRDFWLLMPSREFKFLKKNELNPKLCFFEFAFNTNFYIFDILINLNKIISANFSI